MHDASKYWNPRTNEIDVGDDKQIFKDNSGVWRFQHLCHVPDSSVEYDIIAAPTLERHSVSIDGRTVTPSILCLRCKTHGWIKNGVWSSV